MTRIWNWLETPPHLAKVTLGFLVGMHILFAVTMCLLNDVVYRYLWPVWFGAAALLCLIAVIRFTQRTVSLAGAATVTAFVGRTIAVCWSWQDGLLTSLPAARVLVSIGAWVALAFLSTLVFFRGLLQVTTKNG